mgnify:CR=1 FL=1
MPYDPLKHQPRHYDSQDQELARRFAVLLKKELKGLLCDVIFFGSSARGNAHGVLGNDIDVLVLIDDRVKTVSEELTEAYRILAKKCAEMTSRRMHINTLRMSNFLEYSINGDPVSVNILRDGIPLLAAGFFETLQNLSSKGKITPNPEIVWAYFNKAPLTILSAKGHMMQAMTELSWAALEATHAALQKMGEVPYTPHHAVLLVKHRLVNEGKMDKKMGGTLGELYDIERKIANREIKEIDGAKYDELYSKTKDYIQALNAIISSTHMHQTIGKD